MLVIVDGNHLLHRVCRVDSLTALQAPEHGGKWGGVFGFVRSLQYALRNADADRCVVVWDSGLSERRLNLYPEYKSHRRGKPQKLKEIDYKLNFNLQMVYVKEVLPLLGISMLSLKGREGDDLIWSAREVGRRVGLQPAVVISEDKDFYLIVDETTILYRPIRKIYVNRENFEEVTGIPYGRATLYKSLLGDSGDYIKGVPGVGPETVKEVVLNCPDTDWDSVEAFCRKHKSSRVKKIAESMDIVKRNYDLVTLGLETFTEEEQQTIEDVITVKRPVDFNEALKLFMQMEFKSITKTFTEWMVPFVSIGARWGRTRVA